MLAYYFVEKKKIRNFATSKIEKLFRFGQQLSFRLLKT